MVSNASRRSYNSLLTSQTEIAASMLLDSDIMRVIPNDGIHYAKSTERRYPLLVSIINFPTHVFSLAVVRLCPQSAVT